MIALLIVIALGLAGWNHTHPATSHECVAPCVIVLPDGTQEDEWSFDYGWKDERTPVVGVWSDR